MRKLIIPVLMLLALLALAPFYIGRHLSAQLQRSHTWPGGIQTQFTDLKNGWLTTTGTLTVSIETAQPGGSPLVYKLISDVTIQHGPVVIHQAALPGRDRVTFGLGGARYSLRQIVLPAQAGQKAMQLDLSSFTALQILDEYDFSGSVRSLIYYPGGEFTRRDTSYKIGKYRQELHFGRAFDSFESTLNFGGLTRSENGSTLKIGRGQFDAYFEKNPEGQWMGEQKGNLSLLQLLQVGQQSFTMKKLKLGAKVNGVSDKLDLLVIAELGSIEVNNQVFVGPIKVDFSADSLNMKAIQSVQRDADKLQLDKLPAKEQQFAFKQLYREFNDALVGASFNLKQFAIGTPNGTIKMNGHINMPIKSVTLPAEATPEQISMAVLTQSKAGVEMEMPVKLVQIGLSIADTILAAQGHEQQEQLMEKEHAKLDNLPKDQQLQRIIAMQTQAQNAVDAQQASKLFTQLLQQHVVKRDGDIYTFSAEYNGLQAAVTPPKYFPIQK